MNEIGQSLKDARIKSGVNLDEASKDLNIDKLALENIEEGNIGCFKDIFELKENIKNYAKYLGLDETKIIDEFNEYLFEYTSKIPVEEIEKALVDKRKEKPKEEISSPYTTEIKKTKKVYYVIIYALIALLVIVAVIWAIRQISVNSELINYVNYL